MCRCVDKPRPAPGLAGAPAAQAQQQAAKTHPALEGAGWRNPLDPSQAFGESFDNWWCPSAPAPATAGSPADSTFTRESQATTPVQGEESEEWGEGKDTIDSALFDGFGSDAFFRDLASSFAGQGSELVSAATAEVTAPAPAPVASCHQVAPLAALAPAASDTSFEALAMRIEQAPLQEPDLCFAPELLFPAPHPFSEASRGACAPTPKMAPVHKPVAVKTEGADVDKLCKWKRRDIAKHLAGERSRRAKRMGKVHTLQALIAEGLPRKPTVNQVLAAAIAQIKQVKAQGKPLAPAIQGQGAAESGDVSFRDMFKASSFARTMVLDESHCVVEASQGMLQALQWPGPESTIKGQYIASVMHPEDACALVGEAQGFRASGLGESSVQAIRTVVSFMGFTPMTGMCDAGGCLAFPSGYMPQAAVDVTISNKMMFVCVP